MTIRDLSVVPGAAVSCIATFGTHSVHIRMRTAVLGCRLPGAMKPSMCGDFVDSRAHRCTPLPGRKLLYTEGVGGSSPSPPIEYGTLEKAQTAPFSPTKSNPPLTSICVAARVSYRGCHRHPGSQVGYGYWFRLPERSLIWRRRAGVSARHMGADLGAQRRRAPWRPSFSCRARSRP
jgi:hypothetical protein